MNMRGTKVSLLSAAGRLMDRARELGNHTIAASILSATAESADRLKEKNFVEQVFLGFRFSQ